MFEEIIAQNVSRLRNLCIRAWVGVTRRITARTRIEWQREREAAATVERTGSAE